MLAGTVVHADGTTESSAAHLNGFSIVQAANRDEVVELLRDHPLLALGDDYSIEVFEVPR